MTSQRLTSIITLALALAGAGLACGSDNPAADASATGGRGGTTATGGAGGTGGRGGTGGTAGRGGAGGAGGTGGATGGTGGSASDAAATGGTGGAATGGAGGATGGTGGTTGADASADTNTPADLPVDQPLPVDLPPDLPPDNAPATTVNVSDCAQFMCPQLTSIASQCQASETTCTHSKEGDQTNYCHSNGVKKVANTTFSGASYTTIMDVFKANSGDDCYQLEIRGTGGTPDMQNWTFKSTAGATLATATWRSDTGQLTIRCDNVNYVIGNVGCPGTDGQPDDTGAECPAGTCTEP